MNKLTAHPLADLVPMMAPAEYEAFKADIAENGQRDTIVLYENAVRLRINRKTPPIVCIGDTTRVLGPVKTDS